jgi:hypothetical protein
LLLIVVVVIPELARTWLTLPKADAEFQRNLVDWRRGGPTPSGGWTRSGPPVETPDCVLVGVQRRLVDAEECFAKNATEVKRWHVAFLQTYLRGGNLKGTAYWLEYLLPRLSPEAAGRKAARFLTLYDNIASGGRRPGSYVWLADLASVPGLQSYFGFRYFRFDGAHRLSCQYVQGIRQIPCMVFSLRSES